LAKLTFRHRNVHQRGCRGHSLAKLPASHVFYQRDSLSAAERFTYND